MSESLDIVQMSVEEFLQQEEVATVRHEFVRGRIFAMTGATHAHNVICMSIHSRLHAHLRRTGCHAYINDMKVRIEVADCFYYPDVVVTCEPRRPKDVFVSAPVLIVEVLSPSTKQIDRREKLVAYQQLASLNQYIVVHQSKPLVELHAKQKDDKWITSILRISDQLCLESLPNGSLKIAVSDIYEDLDLSLLVEESTEEYEFA